MTQEASNTRKIRELLETRRLALLSRYKGGLERAEEELATPEPEMVEMASEQWDARVLSIMSDADAFTLENIVAAIHRLEGGTYGTCTVCGGPIEPARLRAIPEAAECVECVRFAEETPPRSITSIGPGR